jgi:hypothetical protein
LITTGTQTIAGTKTFNDATKNNGGIFLQNASSSSLAGYMNLGGLTNGVKFTSGGGISNSFTLPSATGYTFTFPNTTGTIALTSDLTGGTVTSVAALTIGTTGTDLSSSVANSTTTPVITLNVPTASAANRGALASADWSTFNNKQSAITLTTTGTSGAATFSSNTLNIPNYGSALSGYLPLTGGTLTGTLVGTSVILSGNVTAGGTIATTSSSGVSFINTSITTNNAYIRLVGSAHGFIAGREGSAGGQIFIGASAYASVIGSESTDPLQFATNNTVVATITSGGNVLIGTTTNSGYKLDVNGTGRFSGQTSIGGTILGSALLTVRGSTSIANGGVLYLWDSANSTAPYIGNSSNNITFYTNIGATALTIASTGASTFTSSVTATAFIPSGATVPTNGMYLSAANTLNFATASTNRLTIGSTGAASFSSTVSLTDELIFLGASVNTSIKTFGSTNRDRLRIRAYNEVNIDSDVLLTFSTGGSTRVIIDSSGRTSIGYTTNPSTYMLDVNGTGRFTGALTGTSATFSGALNVGSSGSLSINAGSAATPLLTQSTNYTEIYRRSGGVGIYLGGTGDAANYYDNTIHNFRTSGGGATRMIIDASGNLTVGSTAGTGAGTLYAGAATFSSDVILSAANPFVYGGTSVGGVGISNISGSSYIKIYAASHATLANNIQFVNASSTSFLISNTGAATFSSSVTASDFIQLNAVSGYASKLIFYRAGYNYWYAGSPSNSSAFAIGENSALTSPALSISSGGAATFSSTCTATGFFESSDSRLKTLIQDNCQTKGIASITPKLYTKNGKVELGYYAQDFVGILDSAVSKGSDDMLSLSYREVLVAKVYALEQRIKELENK